MFATIIKKVPEGYIIPVRMLVLTSVNVLCTIGISYQLSRLVSPEQYGNWRLFLMITSFSGIFHLGINDGLNLKWLFSPSAIWQNDCKRDIVYVVVQQCSLYFVAIFCYFISLLTGYKISLSLIMLITNQVVFQNIAGVIQIYFNRSGNFHYGPLFAILGQGVFWISLLLIPKEVVNLTILSNIQAMSLLFPMTWIMGRQLRQWPLVTRQDFRILTIWSSLKRCISLGFPVLLTGLLFLGFQQIDKLVAAGFYPAREFGYYTFSASLLNIVLTISFSMGNFFLHKLITNRNNTTVYYNKAVMIVCLVAGFSLILIKPLQLFIHTHLSEYAGSAIYLGYLIGFTGPYLLIQLAQYNLFKVLKKQKVFFG